MPAAAEIYLRAMDGHRILLKASIRERLIFGQGRGHAYGHDLDLWVTISSTGGAVIFSCTLFEAQRVRHCPEYFVAPIIYAC
jgi:hypothetical protein